MMKVVSRCGRLLVIALMAIGGVAASAHAEHGAVEINPPGTAIQGIADDPTLSYGDQVVTCDTGFVTGATSDPASDIVDVDTDFGEPCGLQPANLQATIDCNDGELTRLHALDPINDTGEVDELLPGFRCTVVAMGICTLAVSEQDLPIPGGVNRADLVGETLEVEVDVIVTNSNSLCGPTPDGVGRFSAVSELDPAIESTNRRRGPTST
jgi:hypothetical protein